MTTPICHRQVKDKWRCKGESNPYFGLQRTTTYTATPSPVLDYEFNVTGRDRKRCMSLLVRSAPVIQTSTCSAIE